MAACSLGHQAEGLLEHPRLTVMRNYDGTAPVLCRHCEDMPCAQVCPVRAISVEAESVRINESKCIGCKLCVIACPFGAVNPAAGKPEAQEDCFEDYVPVSALSDVPFSYPSMNPILAWNAGRRVIAVKCDLCYFREEGPACVQNCPNNALALANADSAAHVDDAKRYNAAEGLATLNLTSSADENNPGEA
ncbi:MAG: 4Fe-4S dicluster domain-containing protein [Desulfovibrio sp.]|jgi:hydrogenase-4 component A|nr:4Fe-4S dicluster domain-containing protein [Desulfovibrio sp.]